MELRLLKTSIAFARAIELAAGFGILLLGLSIFSYVVVKDASTPRTQESSGGSLVPLFLIIAGPGILVATGSFFQVIRQKIWAAAVVFVGGVLSIFFVALNPGLNYYFVQDLWVQRMLSADFLVIILTMMAAFTNALLTIDSRLSSFVWRGALGATIGALISILIYMYQVSYARLFFLAFLMLLWIPAAYGSFVGAILWLVHRKFETKLNFVVRAFIGFVLVSAIGLPYVYFTKQEFVAGIGENLLTTVLWDSVLGGMVMGLPAGLLVPSGRRRIDRSGGLVPQAS